MSSNTLFQVPYLRTSRTYPNDLNSLSIELNKSYIDTALCVNLRTIGIFSTKYASITGESWFLDVTRKQQGIRQAYLFTSFSPINHNLNLEDVARFTRCYGEYTDGTNWYGVIFASSVAIAGQRSFYIDPTNILFMTGAGAPTLVSGIIVIEWLSQI